MNRSEFSIHCIPPTDLLYYSVQIDGTVCKCTRVYHTKLNCISSTIKNYSVCKNCKSNLAILFKHVGIYCTVRYYSIYPRTVRDSVQYTTYSMEWI